MAQQKLSDFVSLPQGAQIVPDQRGAGTVTSGWAQVTTRNCIGALLSTGEHVATATLDFKLEQAQDSSGTGAKDLKTATQLGDTDDNSQVALEATYSDLDTANGFTWVRASVTVASANCDYNVILFAVWSMQPPLIVLSGTQLLEYA